MKVEIVFTAVFITLMVAYGVKSAPLTEENDSEKASTRSAEEENEERSDHVVQNAPSEKESDLAEVELRTITSESESETSNVKVNSLEKDSDRETRKAEYDGELIDAENEDIFNNVAMRTFESHENEKNANDELKNADVEVEEPFSDAVEARSPEKESDKGIKRTQNNEDNVEDEEKTAVVSKDVDKRAPEKESDKGLKNAENNEDLKNSAVYVEEKSFSEVGDMAERQPETESGKIYNNDQIEDSKVKAGEMTEKSNDKVDVADSLEETETISDNIENVNSDVDNSEVVAGEKLANKENLVEPVLPQEIDSSLKNDETGDSELTKAQDVQVDEQSVSEKAGGGQTLERGSGEDEDLNLKTATDVAVNQETSERTVAVDEEISERGVPDSDQSVDTRSVQPKIIDTEVRSGFEAQADDDGNVKFTEDDVSAEARSAFPLDRRIVSVTRNINLPIAPLIRPPIILTLPQQPSVYPNPLLPVFSDQQLPVYPDQQYPFSQDLLPPFKSFQELQASNQFQVKTPPLSYLRPSEKKPVQNSYPYQPLTTLPPLPTLPNLSPDSIFYKLTQATNAAKLAGSQFNLPPPINQYGFPNYLSQLI